MGLHFKPGFQCVSRIICIDDNVLWFNLTPYCVWAVTITITTAVSPPRGVGVDLVALTISERPNDVYPQFLGE